ncbi:NAD-dependent epimerase/dehydratase [Hyphomicrobium denitrificans 1NES1]|uniref:NAD-dependent epimerase/dehydratase n=1 Tax=Hyphomicrobium denitrificans 1NES1 TaxID=670307 RepID=N0BCC5_9HYPH|nr:aldehyde reductase [Hyphomicrobium denitrificans]AGK58176.1 NAD-dependent epimerase/dehydratase [Hyphomicrobium denitrificans 1NES1]
MSTEPPVVVTGASGFIAKHVAGEFLKRGYSVRGTIRRLDKADAVRRAVTRLGCDPSALSFVAADLDSDVGWDDAVAGANIVVHMASPFPIAQPDDPDDVILPAREGTLRVLKAATRAHAKRLVLTSSSVAIFYGSGLPIGHIYSEDDFSDETRNDLTPYIKSKTIAEKAAWQFVKKTPGAPELAVINPAFVQGPALDDDLSTSHDLYRLMARGLYPAAPRIRFPVVDVRDVAAAHVEAALRPEAAGKRYLIGEGQLRLYELGRILARELPDLRSKVPKFELPDVAVRMLAVFDRRLRTILPELGAQKDYTNTRVRAGLGLNLRGSDEAVTAAVRSLRDLRLI